jgi:hypothetical protein
MLYNHEIRFNEELGRVEAHRYYGCRVLACTTPSDVIQIDPILKEEYAHIEKHYQRVGIDCTEEVVWDVEPNLAKNYPRYELSVHTFNKRFNDARQDPKRLHAVNMFNDKNIFLALCQKLDVAIPKTRFFQASELPPDDITFPVFVKKATSASGLGVFRCESYEELKTIVADIKAPYQIQKEIDAKVFLNVQYRVEGDGSVVHIATSEQILDGFTHIGNRFPASYNPRHITDPIAKELARQGLKDVFALDVAVTPDNAFLVVECNPRWNGSTYPTIVAARLGAREWTCVSAPTKVNSLKSIQLGDLEYNAKRGTGVVIVGWGLVKLAKLNLLIIGNKTQQQEYLSALRVAVN